MTNTVAMAVSAQQAHDWILNGSALLIDVREPGEFMEEHIPSALSLPLSRLGDGLKTLGAGGGRKIIFQCLSGKRSQVACNMARDLTAMETYSLEGGIEGWKKAALPVIAAAPGRISIFRQVQIAVGGLLLAFLALGAAGMFWGYCLAGFLGLALTFAGVTGWCGLAMALSFAPWNRPKT